MHEGRRPVFDSKLKSSADEHLVVTRQAEQPEDGDIRYYKVERKIDAGI